MRSPRGFHVNGPGAGVGKRQLASLLSGSRTQAFPPATKATVCARALSPAGQPAGRGWPFANLVMMADGGEPVPEPEVRGPWVDAPVQAASITSMPAVSREVAARIDLIGSPTLRRVIDPRTAHDDPPARPNPAADRVHDERARDLRHVRLLPGPAAL
jgi:hypothetical protein